MHKAYWIILIILIISIFTIGGLKAQGEHQSITNSTETTDVVAVPFDPLGRICGYDAAGIKWLCEWDPNRINLDDAFTGNNTVVDDPREARTTVCPDRFVLQEDGKTCLPVTCADGFYLDLTDLICKPDAVPDEITDKEIEKFKKQLSHYEKNPPTTWDRLDEKWKLEHLLKCWYGLNQGRGIQNLDSFVTSSWMEESDVPKATHVSIIDRAIDTCKAQTTMLEILGDKREIGDVRSRQGWHGIVLPTHGELAADVPVWPQSRVNQEANQGLADNLDYCDAVVRLDLATKRFLGCTPASDIIILHGSVVETQNDVEDKWLEYKTDGGEQQAKEIKAALLAEKRKELLQPKLYKPTGISITEQIYAIENAGWSMTPRDDRSDECHLWNDTKKTIPIELQYLEFLKRCGE